MINKGLENIFFDESCYTKNIDLFTSKYPKYTFFLPPYVDKKEKTTEKSLLDIFDKDFNEKNKNSDVIYIYGLENIDNYLFLKKWLEEKKNRFLVYLEDNEERFSNFLSSSLSEKIITDPDVFIFYKTPIQNEDDFFKEAVSLFPFANIKIFSFVDSDNKKKFDCIKLKILRLSTYYYACHIDDLYLHLNFKHFISNIHKLPNSFYINKFKNIFKGRMAIICGAGPSLSEDIEVLKKNKRQSLDYRRRFSNNGFSIKWNKASSWCYR